MSVFVPGGRGGGTLILSYIRRLGPFNWAQNFEFQYLFMVFRKTNIFVGYEEYFFGVLEIPDIFWVNGRCGARAYVLRTKQNTPSPPGLRAVLCRLKGPFEGETKCGS